MPHDARGKPINSNDASASLALFVAASNPESLSFPGKCREKGYCEEIDDQYST